VLSSQEDRTQAHEYPVKTGTDSNEDNGKGTGKANSKESVKSAVDKVTKWLAAGKRTRTKTKGQAGIKKRQQAKLSQLLLMKQERRKLNLS
jgi:hypothetical protein